MTIATEFTVAANGDIRHDNGTTRYPVLDLHRWLQDLADNAVASGDDLLDITNQTPSERSTDNIITLNAPYNIDDATAEFFYDGSITQDGGDTVYSGLVVVGSVNQATTLKIVQDNLFYDDQDAPFWGTNLNADAGANILMRCMVLTRTGGADVDGKRIRVQARTYKDTNAEFSLTLGLGNATAAIFTNSDLNNQTDAATVDAWTVNKTEGYQGIDINNNSADEYYYLSYDRVSTAGGAGNVNDVYEYAKALQRANHSGTPTIFGMDPELFRGITHEIAYDNQDASEFFTESEELSWGSGATAGTGIILADSEAGVDGGTTGTLWIQLLTGVICTDGIQISGATCNADVNGAPVSKSLTPCFLGTSTGSNLIAAFGIGLSTGDTSVGDQFFPLDQAGPILPPNNQSFTVGGLISGEDRVLVGPKDTGNDYNFNQFTVSAALSGGETTVNIATSGTPGDETTIKSDTPGTGTIRILGSDGVYHRVTYTGFTTTSFTGCAGVPAAAQYANMWISYIDDLAGADELSFSGVYVSDRSLWVRVRDGGASPIKTFQTGATYGSGGGSVTAIRTSDE